MIISTGFDTHTESIEKTVWNFESRKINIEDTKLHILRM